jgi:hypothetical protein
MLFPKGDQLVCRHLSLPCSRLFHHGGVENAGKKNTSTQRTLRIRREREAVLAARNAHQLVNDDSYASRDSVALRALR